MDVVKFLMESKRMCQRYKVCSRCPLNGNCIASIVDPADAVRAVAIVEKWSKEHPVVTNGLKVHEMIPGNERSTVFKEADSNLKGCGFITSEDYVEMRVRKSWWDAEYKEKE